MPMLQVVHPLALVPGPVHVNVDSLPVGLVIDPVALVDIAIDVSELAEAVGTVVLPVSLVTGAILPDLLAVAIAEPANPLAGVLGARRVCIGRPLLPFRMRVIRHVRNGLLQLYLGKVSTVGPLGLLNHGDFHSGGMASPQRLQPDNGLQMRFESGQAAPCRLIVRIIISLSLR